MTTETTAAAPAAAPVTTATSTLFAGEAAPVSQAAPAGGAPEAGAEGSQPPQSAPDTPEQPPALTVPGKDATPEEWAAFYKQLGRPETPDAYELPLPEGDDGAFAKQMAPLLHKHGLTAEQAKGLATDWNAFVASQQQAAEQAAEAAQVAEVQAMHAKNTAEKQELDNEWGQRATENYEMARRAAKQFFPSDKAQDVIAAMESVLGYKETIKMLHGIGRGLGEHDATVGMGQQTSGAKRSPAQILYGRSSN